MGFNSAFKGLMHLPLHIHLDDAKMSEEVQQITHYAYEIMPCYEKFR